jgi:hypothetical protein
MESIILWLFRANFIEASFQISRQPNTKTGWPCRYLHSSYCVLFWSFSSDLSFLEYPAFQVCTETRREEHLSHNRMLHCENSNDKPEEDTGHS